MKITSQVSPWRAESAQEAAGSVPEAGRHAKAGVPNLTVSLSAAGAGAAETFGISTDELERKLTRDDDIGLLVNRALGDQ